MGIVKLEHLLEGEGADDIAVEDEEGRVILAEDIPREGQRAGGAKRLSLDGEMDLDVELQKHDIEYRRNRKKMLRW